MFKLTRFLYNEEEVKLTLISTILRKKHIMECYYWFSELYYSKLDVCDIIWEIYFNYYALINPKLEYYISKKINEYIEKNDIAPLLYIIRNMHSLKHDSNVFLLYQISLCDDLCQEHIYTKFPKSRHLKIYNKKYYPLLLSIHNSNWIDICYYLNKLFDKKIHSFDIYETIVSYFSHENKIQLLDLWKRKMYKHDFHYILRFICNLKIDNIILNHKNVYISPQKEDIDEIKAIEEEGIPLTNKGNTQIYKTLYYKRLFCIDENIGAFNLIRFNIPNYKMENYNWEYYASFVPLWRERIKSFNGKINDESKRIIFDDDESLENFYDTYGYELDEQSKDVQDFSLLEIKKKDYTDWFCYVNSKTNNNKEGNNLENKDEIVIDCDFDCDLPDNFKLKIKN